MPKETSNDLKFTLDETMVPFLGWLPFRQYLPDKPHPFGVLNRVIAMSKVKFIVDFEIYFGTFNEESHSVKDLVPRLITTLITLQKGVLFFF